MKGLSTKASIVVIAVTSIAVAAWMYVQQPESPIKPLQVQSKQIRFSFEISNSSPRSLRDVQFETFMPIAEGPFQKLIELKTDRNVSRSGAQNTGETLSLELDRIPPYGHRQLSVTAELQHRNVSSHSEIPEPNEYLQDSPKLSLQHPSVTRLVETFQQQNLGPQEVGHWLHNNIEYSGYQAEDQTAAIALTQLRGDCTEYSYAFVALMRAMEIPARAVAGFVVPEQAAVLKSGSYHNWAEYHDGERWIIVDPQEDVYDADGRHYVAFRYLDLNSDGLSNSQRFLAFDQRLTVRMN